MHNLFFIFSEQKLIALSNINEKIILFESKNEVSANSVVLKLFDFFNYREALDLLFLANKEDYIALIRMDDNGEDFLHISRQEYDIISAEFKRKINDK